MDPVESDEIVRAFAAFMNEAVQRVRRDRDDGVPLVEVLREHLGADPRALPVVALDVESHQFVNLDVALDAVVEEQGGGTVVGVGGGDQRHHASLGDMVQQSGQWGQFPVAAVERLNLPDGPGSHRQAISFGVHLFHWNGVPVAACQRPANTSYGRGKAVVEVLAAASVAEELIARVRVLMVERSVFRGQVLTLGVADEAYVPGVGGISFHHRPRLTAADIVLPAGSLARIERHVLGPARHSAALRAAGQHLKRGVLLFGPPGTGKTHTVRYLLSTLEGVTTVLLSGTSLRFVGAAAELAVALQPAIVVLEDVDLVAEHRDLHHDPQPLLFTLLEVMDGLAGDSDVAFVLTTNRPDLLEPALAQRPGRVDLAVEIPLPDEPGRVALLQLYTRGLGVTAEAIAEIAVRTPGFTASFAKELVRRATLIAAEGSRAPEDEHLRAAVEELLDDRETLTRSLLGARPQP